MSRLQSIIRANSAYQDLWQSSNFSAFIDHVNSTYGVKLKSLPPVQYPVCYLNNTHATNTDSFDSLPQLVFMGLNASTPSERSPVASWDNTHSKNEEYWEHVQQYDRTGHGVDANCKPAKTRGQSNAYFDSIVNFKAPGMAMLHVDLFALRHTNAKDIEKILKDKNDKVTQSFMGAQARIAIDLLCSLAPGQIVVINALVRRILSTDSYISNLSHCIEQRNSTDYDGSYKWVGCDPLRDTVIHGSGMIAYGRSDADSIARLEAAVRAAAYTSSEL